MSSRYPNAEIVKDIGSGINFRRKGLLSILQRVKDGDIRSVAIASRDRLCRFAFELLEWYFKQHDVQLLVLDSDDQSPEQELSDDLLSIVQVFCCRRNGRRRYRTIEDKDDTCEAETDKGAEDGAEEVCGAC
jgi:predicted site-specific integrase-resolvase